MKEEIINKMRSVSIAEVWNHIRGEQIPEDEVVQIRCPLHGDGKDETSKGSARYYPDSNKIYCWGCSKVRDTIQIVMELKEFSFSEAVMWISETFLGESVSLLEINKQRKSDIEKQVNKIDVDIKKIRRSIDRDILLRLIYVRLLLETDIDGKEDLISKLRFKINAVERSS